MYIISSFEEQKEKTVFLIALHVNNQTETYEEQYAGGMNEMTQNFL